MDVVYDHGVLSYLFDDLILLDWERDTRAVQEHCLVLLRSLVANTGAAAGDGECLEEMWSKRLHKAARINLGDRCELIAGCANIGLS